MAFGLSIIGSTAATTLILVNKSRKSGVKQLRTLLGLNYIKPPEPAALRYFLVSITATCVYIQRCATILVLVDEQR